MRRIHTDYANRLPDDDGMAIVFSKEELDEIASLLEHMREIANDSGRPITRIEKELRTLMEVENECVNSEHVVVRTAVE